MPERGFDTNFWAKPFVQKLPAQGKLLFAYLKTNVHCNQAGVYTITPSTIAFETGLSLAEIPGLLESLEPEVVWYPEENIVWVKPFLEEQAKSSKFIASALSIISRDRLPEDLSEDFQEYNSHLLARITSNYSIGLTKKECVAIRDKFTCQYCRKVISLPTDYEMDHVIPKVRGGKDNYINLVASCRACNQRKMDKTPDEAGFVTPHPKAFHAAQAVFLLKNSPELKKSWLQLFPEREGVVDSILSNIEQHYSILTQDTSLSNANASSVSSSKSDSGTGKGGGDGGEVGVVKGEKDSETATPTSESEIEESLSPGDREVISVWRSVKGVNLPTFAAAELVTKLRTEFPDVDILAESKAWAARKLSEPLTHKSRPSGQIWNFMEKRRKWDKEKRGEYEQREAQQRTDAHRKDPLQAFRDAGGTVILSGEEAEAGNEDGAV
jgi:hypothetical protein